MGATAGEQQDAVDGARYQEMRRALAAFEAAAADAAVAGAAGAVDASGKCGAAPPRHRAFYAALRGVLSQCACDPDPASRSARLAAAHRWFTARRPREQPADVDAAAAMAASLSVSAASQGRAQPGGGGAVAAAASTSCGDGPQPLRRDMAARAGKGKGAAGGSTDRWQRQSSRRSSSGGGSSDGDWPGGGGDAVAGAEGAAGQGECLGSYAAGRAPALRVQQPSIGRQPAVRPAGGAGARVPPLLGGDAGVFESIALLTGADQGEAAACCRRSGAAVATAAAAASAQGAAQGRAGARSPPGAGCASGGAAGEGGAERAARRAALMAAGAAQAGFEADVGRRMAAYARHRARVEEEIMRRQEARRCAGSGGGGGGSVGGQGGSSMGGDGCAAEAGLARAARSRALAHADSQHEPPSTSAYASARAPGVAEQLASGDGWLRGARRAAMAEGEREVLAAAAALGLALGHGGTGRDESAGGCGSGDGSASGGGAAAAAVVGVLTHALLPLPDQPHLTVRGERACWFAHGAGNGCAAAAELDTWRIAHACPA